MKCLVASAIAVVALSGSAFAADFPAKVMATPAVAAANWTGAYVGLGLGGRMLDADWRTTEIFAPGGGLIPFFFTDPDSSLSSTAFRVSGYAGYNWQINPTWLLGVEADLGWADNKDKELSRIPGLGFLGAGTGSFAEVSGSWDASVRLRGGMLLTPSTLGYLTGGVAFQHLEATATCPFTDGWVCNPVFGTQSFSSSTTRTGWTLGVGVEAMLSEHWLARVEYRYSDFDDFSFVAMPPESNSRWGANARLSTTTQMLTAGLAWKL
jgi:outer membrane immunogenic protein